MNRYFYIIGLIIIAYSCSYNNSEYQSDMMVVKKGFGDSLLTHFPSEVAGSYQIITTFPKICKESNRCGVLLMLSNDNFERQKPILKEITFNSIDSNYLIINSQNRTFFDSINQDFLVPIPNISHIVASSNIYDEIIDRDLSHLEYHVFKKGSGIYINKDFLPENNNLPKYWRHGFSEGVATSSDSTIYYWLEIW